MGGSSLEAKAIEKFIRISPRKLRYVADVVRNKSVEEAVDILTFTPKKAASILKKAVESAAANATENHEMEEDGLFISRIMVNEGPILKRFSAWAQPGQYQWIFDCLPQLIVTCLTRWLPVASGRTFTTGLTWWGCTCPPWRSVGTIFRCWHTTSCENTQHVWGAQWKT